MTRGPQRDRDLHGDVVRGDRRTDAGLRSATPTPARRGSTSRSIASATSRSAMTTTCWVRCHRTIRTPPTRTSTSTLSTSPAAAPQAACSSASAAKASRSTSRRSSTWSTATPSGPRDGETDDLADKNITTLALEVPISCLTARHEPVIGGWTTASVREDARSDDTASVAATPPGRTPRCRASACRWSTKW